MELYNSNAILMDIDDILPLIGEFGKYQQLLDVLFCIMGVPLTYHLLIMYFFTLSPPWKCVSNSPVCLFNGTMAKDDNRRCSMPRSEWEFAGPRGYSLVTQFDIQCGNEWLLSLTHSLFFIGWGAGAILIGWIGDKYGRKIVFFPSLTVIIVVGFLTSFMPNIYLIMACRFIIGFFITGGTLQIFIIISEIVGHKYRGFAGLIIFAFGSVALLFLTLKAYLIRNWKLLSILSTAPYIFLLPFYKVVPESVRWLQHQGRRGEAMAILRRIAKWNKKELPANIELSPPKNVTHKTNPLSLFRTRKIALSTLTQGFIWLATTTCYYCFFLAADDLNGSPYRDQLIMILSGMPSLLSTVYCMNRFGRKRTALISLLVGGVLCLGIAFIPTTSDNLRISRVICGMFGKFMIATALDCLYTWSLELFPTNIRAEGMGFLQITSHVGTGTAPFITKGMHSLGKGAPFIVMGIPSLISAVLGMTLPDTNETKLIEDLDENRSNSITPTKDIELECRS